VHARQVGVGLVAARELPGPHRREARRQVLAGEEVLEAAVGRDHASGDRGARLARQALAVGGEDRRRHPAERREEGALLGVVHDLLGDLGRHALHHHAGMDDALLHPLAQQLGGLRHVGRQGAQAGDPRAVVVRVAER
jgi:hypothetical protein